MSLPIRKKLVPKSKYSIKCPYTMIPQIIVVHNTANDASAENEIAYMIRNDNKVSYHYAIDDKEIVQGVPENRNTWNAGDGNGNGNRKGISIEICYSKSGGDRFIKAEKLASKFIAHKLKEKGWDISRVKKHQDFSGKYCPHRTLDLGWKRFLNMIQDELDKLKAPKEEVKKEENKVEDKPKIKEENKQETKTSTLKNNLVVDGYWGKETTKALQRALNTPVDGIISGQYKNNITSSIIGVDFGKPYGSIVIKALQRKLNVKVDGLLGKETIKALQKYLGTPIDGKISKPSIMVKALQIKLNEGKF